MAFVFVVFVLSLGSSRPLFVLFVVRFLYAFLLALHPHELKTLTPPFVELVTDAPRLE